MRTIRTARLALLLSLPAMWPAMAQPNVIVPDGRTQTHLKVSGTTTSITTGTVSGPNAFNSFSRFGVGRGNTVNLHLPSGTKNLINLVHDAPAYVNGTLNSYANGKIGGNVYFADPHGFVVGHSGVVNVGSFNVSTPSKEFTDKIVGPHGRVDSGAVANLIKGSFPISPDGNIRIHGRINAADGVRLTGQNVIVGGRAGSRARLNRHHAAQFAATVNSRGLRSGTRIVVRNGSIRIVAAHNARVSGRLVAHHRAGVTGDIVVTAGKAIRIASTAKLKAANRHGDAGNIVLRAGGALTVVSGATFNASSAVGNGGVVELSAHGQFAIGSKIKVNVAAPHGRSGALVIDPNKIEIGTTAPSDSSITYYSNGEISNMVSAMDGQGTLVFQADDSITLDAGGVIDGRSGGNASVAVELNAGNTITIDGAIDTRTYTGPDVTGLLADSSVQSTGNSGNVTLDAPNITIGSTGKIYADVNNATGQNATDYTAGDVSLAASDADNNGVLPSNAVTSISIAGTITGGAISATATSHASTVYSDSASAMAAGVISGVLDGLNGGYVKSKAKAKVTVEGTANIAASGAVTLSSVGSEKASDPAITFSLGALQDAVAASVVVGIVNADIATQVKSGATISSGDLTVTASNNADLSVDALVFSASTAYDGALAYTTGTVNTRATVDPGVTITKVGNVVVGAQNTNSFSTLARSFAAGTGKAAVAVAISDVTNKAAANLGAGIPQTASAGSILVYSGSNTIKNAVSASSTVGSNFLVSGLANALGTLSTSVAGAFGPGGPFDGTGAGEAASSNGTIAGMRGGITLALNLSSLDSTASIANVAPNSSGTMVSSGTAPTIVGSGGVAVVSSLTDAGIRGDASSTINSNPSGTPTNPTTGAALSMAVNVDQITQSSNAYIGSGVSITAPEIGVKANMTSPITITWLNFDGFSAVTSHFNSNLGVVNDILTSYANATANSATKGISGAVNYFEVDSSTTAWVGSGANLTQTGNICETAGGNTCWTSNLGAAGLAGVPTNLTTIDWAHDIEVLASTTTSSINIGGNFSWLTVFGTNSTSSTGKAIGGSANVNIFGTDTVAGIGAGAIVNADGTVDVSATTSDKIYAVAPTSGKGSGLGLNGIASVLQLDNHTSASISDRAQVTAGSLSIAAQQTISSFDIGGGVGASKATGVGVVVALASMTTDTSAFIGDNSSVLSLTGATDDDSNIAPTAAGRISTSTLNVDALTVGRLTTVAVAAEAANNTPDPTDPPAVRATEPSGPGYLAAVTAFFKTKGAEAAQKISTTYSNLTNTVSDPVEGGNVTAGAGSAAVDLTSIGTHAKVADATLEGLSGSNNSVAVQALNNTIIDTASGAAALSKGAPGTTYTVGLAGAVAVTLSGDMTTANIERSTVTAHKTTVQALAGGESTTVGLAVALTAGSGNGAQASASVSVAQIDDGVQAWIDSSTVGSTSSDPAGDIAVLAYRTTDIGIGAGSLYGGGGSGNSSGFGVSMTYAEIGDPSSGAAVSAVLSNSEVSNTNGLDVEAFDTSRIVSGAATAGGGANASGFSGSVVVNDISPTILAEITTVPTLSGAATVTGGITVSGDVIVSASAGSVAALDKIISDAAKAGNNGAAPTDDSGLDFSGGAVSPTDATGAAIIAVAGNVQVGKSNVGISIVVNRIGTRHEALIDHLASVTSTGGVVDVSATDNSEILGIAVGVGGATGAVAGNGSVAYNAINNAITARIGDGTGTSDAANQPTATVEAAAVQVSAQDNETIRGAAGAISVNIGGGNAVGLSAAVDQIATDVSAATHGATVKADNALGSDSDPLIADNLQAGSILVSGSSNADITTIAIGAAISAGTGTANTPQSNLAALIAGMAPGGGTAPTVPSSGLAGAGSLALSTEATSVHSTIDSGGNGYNSSVAANNDVLVLASNTDSISAYAGALSVSIGGGKGVGAAVVVNTIGGKTSADISNSTVDAHAKGNASTVSNGMLATAVDPSASRTPATDPSLATGTTAVEGIAIVATSRQTANTVSATYSMSPDGLTVSANAITNVMGGTTEAKATSSSLNTNLVAGETSGVDVTAFSGSYANNLDVGLADAGSGGSGTIVLVINTMNRTTTASVDSTDIGSSSVSSAPVVIFANAFQGTAGEAVGAAGSAESAAVTGSALANLFRSTTTASLDHGTVYSSGLSVTAKGKNGFFAAIGSGALGSGAGIGATVLVTTSNNTVRALVGDGDPTSAATTLYLTGALAVQATDKTVASAYVIVGSIGDNLGISAQFSGLFISNTVDAELDNTTVSNTATAAADGAITVSATENDSLAPVVGGVAGGGTAGIGAAVNLVILKSDTKALMAGDTVTTGGVVSVSAHSNRDVNPITVNAGLGGQAGLAGTVGVVLIGSGASSDELSVLNAGGTLGSAGSATGTNVVAATGSGVDGISAQIVNGSTTAGEIDIKAQAHTSVRNIVGALAVGIKGGFGAAVGFTEVDQKVTAKATDGSLTAPTVSIDASAGDHNGGHAAETWGIAGAGGLYVGLGAAVGKSTVDNTVTAELGATTDGGSDGGSTGVISVSASDTSSLASHGLGFAGGVGAVGLSLAFSQKSSTVTADIAPSTSVTNFANVAIAAAGSGAVDSTAIAGAAGILSGTGASAQASDSETVKAQIGDHASVSAAGASGVMVSASATPEVSAKSYGVAAGGVGIGVSVADATAAAKVTADVGDDSTISDGSLTIIASALVPQSGHSADAYAVGSGGGALLGAQATVVKAENDSSATAYGGKNLNLPAADVTIASEVDSNQLAKATGIAAGFYAGGASVADASSNTHSIAYLDTGAVTASNNVGALSIAATGNDTNESDAIAGSGGYFAGAAAVAETGATSVTTATLKGDSTQNTLYFGSLGIYAAHAATYKANGNAVEASSIGASGGRATNSVTSTTTTEVGPNLIVNSAGGDMNVIASDTVSQNGGGAQAGSGGVASGAAALSDATVTQNVTSHIDHDTVLSLNADPLTALGAIDIEAYNFLSADDTVSLNAGGPFAGGGAHSTMHANATDSVLIDDGVTLFSAGSLFIGTASQMDASNYAIAKLYGLVTGAGASTNSSQYVTQVVSIGKAKVEGWGPVDIYAGQSGDGAYGTDISSYGNTVVYNYAVVPITTEYKGQSSAESHSTLTLATGSQILGVGNVFLGATPGSVSSTGNGTNYNPYLKLVSTEKHDNAGKAPVTSSDVVMDGTVAAGIHNREIITIGYDGTVTLASGNSPDPLTLEYVSDPSQFDPTMSYNHQAVQWTLVNSFSPYNDAVDQIASLSGLTVAQVKSDIAANQPISAQGDDAAGTKQREIDTLVKQLGYMSKGSGPAYRFGNIFASAGNVSILAGSLRGTTVNGVAPSVAARGSAAIGIDNQGIDFLFLSDLTLSGISGGRINFTGAATDSSAQGITFSRDLSDTTPSIIVDASYSATNVNREPIDRNGNVLATTPDIYFGGPISNENGLLSVTNLLGNVLITRDIRAGTVVMTVPNGMIGGNLGANSVYNTNYDVASQWSSVEYRPTDVLTAVYAAATYLGTFPGATGGVYVDGNPADTPYYYYTGGGQDPHYAPISDLNPAYQDLVFSARMMTFKYHDDRHAYDGYAGALYSAVFLPGGVYNSGSNTWDYAGSVGHVWSETEPPFACPDGVCGAGFPIIRLQSQVLNGVTSSASGNASSPSTISAGKAIILSAAVINIDGNISAGQSSNYSVDIGANAENHINHIKHNRHLLARYRSEAAAGKYVDLSPFVSTINGSDVKVTAKYDVLTNQILLDPVVQGVGGYVYLNGKIVSTSSSGSPMGNITVHGGAGTVTVNNTTSVPLVTNIINTGVSAASVVELVDHAKNKTTWYVYDAGAAANRQVSVYQQAGVNNSGGYASLSPVAVTANAGLSYQPADMLYQWTDTAHLTRSGAGGISNNFGWSFDTSGNGYGPIAPWTRSAPTVVAGTQDTNFSETLTATGSYTEISYGPLQIGVLLPNFHIWNKDIYDNLTLTAHNSVKANFPIGIHFTGGGTSNISINSNASIVVDKSINNLQGATTLTTTGANASITGGGAPFISGTSVTLNAPGGVGTLGAPLPVVTYGGTLTATSVDHDIALSVTGSVVIGHIKANPATAGAAPQGNVYLSATGDITQASTSDAANPVVVGKSITLNTSGGAIGAVSGIDQNGNATLNDINPIVIEATATPLDDGTYDGGILNSQSAGGTYIVQSTGDLRLGAVSSDGPVFLAAMAADGKPANILNGLSTGGLTAEQTAYLHQVWAQLDLLGTANGNGPPASVISYQSTIDGAYNDYWQLRNLAFADGTSYDISALGRTVISAQLAAELGVDASTITDAQIQAEATKRFQRDQYLLGLKTPEQLGVTLDALFGTAAGQTDQFRQAVSTSALTTALATFDAGFSYTLPTNSQLYADLSSGSRWTQDQLTYIVSAGANPENNAAAPSIDSLPLNVSGRQVMLYAPSGDIGSLAVPTTFSFTSDGSVALTDTEKGLLATAGPGQLTVTTSTANGVTTYNVSVEQRSLVKVSPLGPVSAKAKSQIYLGSASDLRLGGIPTASFGPIAAAASAGVQTTAGGEVLLQAVGSIEGGVAGQVAISGDISSLTLISETGSIGLAGAAGTDPASNDNALLLALTGSPVGNLDQVQAPHGIYIRQTSGDLSLGNINAGTGPDGVLQLGASGSIYEEAAFTDRSVVHIVASEIDLRAGGDIGFDGAAFQPLQFKTDGAVTGSAAGKWTLLSPDFGLTVGAAGPYGTLTSGGAMVLDTEAGDLTINADVTAGGALQLLANKAVVFAAGTGAAPIVAQSTGAGVTLASSTLTMGAFTGIDAAGAIVVTTAGNAILGRLSSSLAFGSPGNAITVEAGGSATAGSILGNGDGRDNLLTTGANAGVLLTANGDIGSSSAPLVVSASASAFNAAGGAFMTVGQEMHVTSGVATLGPLSITGAPSLVLDTLTSGTTLTVLSSAGSVTIGNATSGGGQTIHAAQNVIFDQLNSNAGDIGITADNGLIQGTTVAANGSASLVAKNFIKGNTGNTLTAATGSATLTAGGLIDWATLNAGTTINVGSTGGSVTLGSATSGGTQTIHAAQDVAFKQLTATGIAGDPGDISVTSDHGSISGGSVSANGDVSFNGGASLDIATINADSATLATPHDLTIGQLNVYRAITIGADVINVTAKQLPSVPAIPLHVTVTGYRGGAATYANLNIDPPQIIIDRLSIIRSVIATDSPSLTIAHGYVPGEMILNTPAGRIFLNSRNPGPVNGVDLQLYDPSGVFTMREIGNANYSDALIVYHDAEIPSAYSDYGGGGFTSTSLVRSSLESRETTGPKADIMRALYLRGLFDGARSLGPIEVIGDGPAVNIGGQFQPVNGRKRRKKHRSHAHKAAASSSYELTSASLGFSQ